MPDIAMCVPYNDFGPGFYCTGDAMAAGQWACHRGSSGFINKYDIDLEDLKVLDLSDSGINMLSWLAVILENREFRISSPNVGRFVEYLRTNFWPDYEGSDIIIGTRCDDSYFSFVRMFLDGKLSYGQLKYAMTLGQAGQQIVIKSAAAFDALRFISCQRAEAAEFFPKRKIRDANARVACIAEKEMGRGDGLYIADILREEVMPGDRRL